MAHPPARRGGGAGDKADHRFLRLRAAQEFGALLLGGAAGRAGLGARLVNGVEHRQVEVLGAALPGRDAADHPGAVGDRLLGVEGALRAGEALADHGRRGIDEDRHYAASFAAATTLRAASSKFSAASSGSPDWLKMRRPSSTLVPSRRTTNGTCRLTS